MANNSGVVTSSAGSNHGMMGSNTGGSGSDHSTSGAGGGGAGLSNGTLDSHDSGLNKRLVQNEPSDGSTEESNAVDGNNLGGSSAGNDVDDEGKVESQAKRMRGTNSNQIPVSSANMGMAGQNNAAYMAAAQSYHNALAAINYTGVALQTNKNATSPGGANAASVPVSSAHGYTQATQAQLQGHQAATLQQQQQSQQQQLLNQYQAMAAAALANPAAFQNPALAMQQMAAAAAAGNQAGNQNNVNMNMNAANAAMNPFAAAAAMNPLLAASLPQIAAAQRASMLASAQQGNAAGALQGAQMNHNTLQSMQNAAAAGNQAANAAAAAAFNPFGVQFGGPGGATSLPYQQAQNQQALLAAYASSQLAAARGPGPGAGAGQTMASQQLYNPAAAAAAAAAAAGNGQGVKRMRPA